MPLHEDYRPRGFDGFIGNPKVTGKLRAVLKRAESTGNGCAVWVDGPSGTGKTTLAKIAANVLKADPGLDLIELDGPKCNGEAVRALEDLLATRAMGGGFRVVIVNEAHDMSRKGVQLWLTLLERLPRKCAVFFTTTQGRTGSLFGDFEGPLKSRCVCLSLTSQGLAKAFAVRAQEIAEAEGLGGASEREYLALVQKCKNNFRAVLSQIEGFELYRDAGAESA